MARLVIRYNALLPHKPAIWLDGQQRDDVVGVTLTVEAGRFPEATIRLALDEIDVDANVVLDMAPSQIVMSPVSAEHPCQVIPGDTAVPGGALPRS